LQYCHWHGFVVLGISWCRQGKAQRPSSPRVGDNQYVKIILKDSLTGLYYSGNQTWCTKVSEAMNFGTFDTAASTAFEEKPESVNVVLRFEEPECELALPLNLYGAQPRAGRTKAMGGDRMVSVDGG
jgi:hypothetical protein